VQRRSQIITTNKPTPSFFTRRMPFLLLNQRYQSIESITVINHINNSESYLADAVPPDAGQVLRNLTTSPPGVPRQ